MFRGADDPTFQSTLPRRERPVTNAYLSFDYDISIHAPAKGATFAYSIHSIGRKDFNPRSREGSDRRRSRLSCWTITFQSTLPRRERPLPPGRGGWLINFNPRSREGSDVSQMAQDVSQIQISIHAPAKGATGYAQDRQGARQISIHAPAKGATFMPDFSSRFRNYFNPRSREGSDAHWLPHCSWSRNFNPRSREGSDPHGHGLTVRRGHFNPRSREGSDLAQKAVFRPQGYFNPRSREGSDCACSPQGWRHQPFQSTLPRRERPDNAKVIGAQNLTFQSTLPRRERRYEMVTSSAGMTFQSTLPRRERQIALSTPWKPLDFNPRSREGSDTKLNQYISDRDISIHAPAKGATRHRTPFSIF